MHAPTLLVLSLAFVLGGCGGGGKQNRPELAPTGICEGRCAAPDRREEPVGRIRLTAEACCGGAKRDRGFRRVDPAAPPLERICRQWHLAPMLSRVIAIPGDGDPGLPQATERAGDMGIFLFAFLLGVRQG